MKKTNSDPIPSIIPLEEIKQAYRKWKESTNTSPSGIHLGHYHALLVNDGQPYTNNHPDPAEKIWYIIYLIINTSIKNGRGPPRYETVHQIMMEKLPGNNKIHRLRRINKYESEYNLIKKCF